MDVDIDLVKGFTTAARFYRDDKGRDYVEISFIGNPDTLIRRVTPQLMAEYREAWNAYCDGVPMKQRAGTPMSELKSMLPEKAEELVRRNVHNLEELAALSDHQCQGLGHGTMTLRKAARDMLSMRVFEQREAAHKKINDAIAPPLPDAVPEVKALEEIVKQQGAKIDALIELLAQKPKPVRKKKKNGAKLDTGDNEPSV